MNKRRVFLFALGIILTSIPSLFLDDLHLIATICLIVGSLVFVIATLKRGWRDSQSYLLLILTSNAAFWLCFGLWHLRLRIAGPSPRQGIDTYAGVIAEWFLVLLALSICEAGVMVWNAISNHHRRYELLGFAGLLIQCTTSLRFAYFFVQGV